MSKQPSTLYIFLFVTLTAFFAGLILMGSNYFLKDRIETNILNERYRSLFALAGMDVTGKSAKEIKRLFALRFSLQQTDQGKERLVFTTEKGKHSHIYPFSGMGFWGPIHGYIALDHTLSRILGIVFTRQEETPGLGAEITGKAFRSQFTNRRFTHTENSTEVLLRIKKAGEAKNPFHIDGITGATETTGRVDLMIRDVLKSALLDRLRRDSHGN